MVFGWGRFADGGNYIAHLFLIEHCAGCWTAVTTVVVIEMSILLTCGTYLCTYYCYIDCTDNLIIHS